MIAYAPDWFYVESRDFNGNKDEEFGITTKRKVIKIDITSMSTDTITGTDPRGVMTTVKKSMARKSLKGCFKMLRDLERQRRDYNYA